MRVLIMGGGWFLGRAVAEEALRRGWKVTTFSRGRSGRDVAGAKPVRGDRTRGSDLRRLAGAGPWDAVVDTSAAEMPPRVVLAAARALEPVAGRYVYVSTVNAYRGWPNEPLTEASELHDAPADADIGEDYGRQKAGSERAVWETFGRDRSVILRPGVILGPGEYVGRLPWWLTRAARGGEILAPGDPAQVIQPVDVRDVAAFALDRAAATDAGAYNVVTPLGRETMGGFLAACLEVTGHRGTLRWVPDDVLLRHGVRQWTELPLWRTTAGAWAVDSALAQAAGLRCRPLAATVEDTWRWLAGGEDPVEHPRRAEHGIAPEREAAILAALG
ncbi:NAD-dependent epimerase/dehydratase family protein [Streptomyces aidingensis]|uniref:Nucleoside-diphosphate-sugar epimerase n=1 Tax=Streptomyces aidingensis TaxID=910347 RepID=A0A1I1H378_9ACTN|nr:NAD-dependent epimerase/dehydratase family protein [Streptomyces aidingensis]SFC18175.1 Nucleoside-diphosphate-sugar epimerase [Streptomyces aidingensis]